MFAEYSRGREARILTVLLRADKKNVKLTSRSLGPCLLQEWMEEAPLECPMGESVMLSLPLQRQDLFRLPGMCACMGGGGRCAWIEHSDLDEKGLAPPDSMVSARHCALPQEPAVARLLILFFFTFLGHTW